jgi:hypothetical protein
MATEKQIAANRANANLSTGPRTVVGKRRSSQNALKHGLSLPLDEASEPRATELAVSFAASTNADPRDYLDFARAHLAVERVRLVQSGLVVNERSLRDAHVLRQLLKTERYERIAVTKRRRAAQKFSAQV